MEETIEEMAKKYPITEQDKLFNIVNFACDLIYMRKDNIQKIVKAVHNAGYRKESDTAREILKWLKAEVIMTEIPHGSEPCEEDVEAVMWWQIEEHFKKKYGVDLGAE